MDTKVKVKGIAVIEVSVNIVGSNGGNSVKTKMCRDNDSCVCCLKRKREKLEIRLGKKMG